MENNDVKSVEPNQADGTESQSLKSPGAILKATREAQGIDIESMARRLKMSVTQIKNIEADNFKECGAVYGRAFVRTYAKNLKIDPEPLVAWFGSATPKASKINVNRVLSGNKSFEGNEIVFRKKSSSGRIGKLILLLIVIAVALVVAWHMKLFGPRAKTEEAALQQAASQPAAVVEQPKAVPSPEASPETVASQPASIPASPETKPEDAKAAAAATEAQAKNGIVVHFKSNSWVKVQSIKTKTTFAQFEGKTNEDRVIDTKNEPVSVIIGYAPGVSMTYKGQPVDLSAYPSVARISLN